MSRLFATLDDYLPPTDAHTVGRTVANHYFLRALWRHGTFDEYHFFLANQAHRTLFAQRHGPLIETLGMGSRIALRDRTELPDAVADPAYVVIHQSDHVTTTAPVIRLRNRLRGHAAVTGFVHSLSYPDHMARYLELVASGVTAKDAIICSSQAGARVVHGLLERCAAVLGGRPVPACPVIPLGIDEEGAPPAADRDAVRRALGWDRDTVAALCLGRFSDCDKMDLFPLLQAAADAMPAHGRLVLAGAANDPDYLRMVHLWARALGIADRVHVETDLSEQRKRELLGAADFFVSVPDNPQETFGLTLLEAMEAGLALVVSDYDGYRDVAGEETGFRIPTRWVPLSCWRTVEHLLDHRTLHRYLAQQTIVDVPALRAALSTLFSDASARAGFGAAARRRFETRFAHRRTIAALEALWTRLREHPLPDDTPADDAFADMDIPRTFSHYPTATIDAETLVRTTPFCRKLESLQAHYPVTGGLQDAVVFSAVSPVAAACITPIPAAQAAAVVARIAPDTPSWRHWYTISWMLKHDLLETVSSPLP